MASGTDDGKNRWEGEATGKEHSIRDRSGRKDLRVHISRSSDGRKHWSDGRRAITRGRVLPSWRWKNTFAAPKRAGDHPLTGPRVKWDLLFCVLRAGRAGQRGRKDEGALYIHLLGYTSRDRGPGAYTFRLR